MCLHHINNYLILQSLINSYQYYRKTDVIDTCAVVEVQYYLNCKSLSLSLLNPT